MAWLAVDKDGTECICSTEPYQDWVDFKWCIENLPESNAVELPKGSIKNLSEENLLGMISRLNLNKIKQNSYGYSFINYNDSNNCYLCGSCYSKYLFSNYVFHRRVQ